MNKYLVIYKNERLNIVYTTEVLSHSCQGAADFVRSTFSDERECFDTIQIVYLLLDMKGEWT